MLMPGPNPKRFGLISLGCGLRTENFKSFPNDSNVQPGLRITTVKNSMYLKAYSLILNKELVNWSKSPKILEISTWLYHRALELERILEII